MSYKCFLILKSREREWSADKHHEDKLIIMDVKLRLTSNELLELELDHDFCMFELNKHNLHH